MNSMQLHDIALYSDFSQLQYTNISTIDESDYRRGKTSFDRIRERQLLKVAKCIGVKSFVEALIKMVLCELKITTGSLKNCVKISWRSDILLNSY